jgi:plastocyanin
MKALALAVVSMALLAGCGGGGGGGGSAQPSGSTKVTMTEYHFDPSTISASQGKLVFFLVNSGTASHDMIISTGSGSASGTIVGRSELVSAGDTFVFTVDNLAAGTYTYYCDQPGHEASGMHGTLTIT